MAQGRLYEVDMRLRPSGSQGPVATSLVSFTAYQRDQAWVWELQALTRARPVAGNTETSERFGNIRQHVLTTPRDKDLIRQEVPAMRERLRVQHGDGDPLKHGPGGILDIEFVVQLGLLLNANDFPEVLKSTEVGDQMQALRDCGWINSSVFNKLLDAYTQLGQARQQAVLVDAGDNFKPGPLLHIAQALCDEILG